MLFSYQKPSKELKNYTTSDLLGVFEKLSDVNEDAMAAYIYTLYRITSYNVCYTKLLRSERAAMLLENFRVEIRNFWLVRPKNLKKLPLNVDKGD